MPFGGQGIDSVSTDYRSLCVHQNDGALAIIAA